jgi:dihydrofolate reductase
LPASLFGRLAGVTKTQYYTATSLDGFIADADNSLDWLFEADRAETGASLFAAFFADVGAMAMGSTTYEWVLAHEHLLDEPQKWQEFYGDMPCWVFSHRDLPTIPGANLSFVRDDVATTHAQMVEAAAGKNVWVMGGGDLAGQFADLGLLDELIIGVAPVTLGAGAPLLPRRILSSRLALESVEQQGSFAFLTYRLTQDHEITGSHI